MLNCQNKWHLDGVPMGLRWFQMEMVREMDFKCYTHSMGHFWSKPGNGIEMVRNKMAHKCILNGFHLAKGTKYNSYILALLCFQRGRKKPPKKETWNDLTVSWSG